jgi:hypothetical protein
MVFMPAMEQAVQELLNPTAMRSRLPFGDEQKPKPVAALLSELRSTQFINPLV